MAQSVKMGLFLTWVSSQWIYCGKKSKFKPNVLCIVESHFVNGKYAEERIHIEMAIVSSGWWDYGDFRFPCLKGACISCVYKYS